MKQLAVANFTSFVIVNNTPQSTIYNKAAFLKNLFLSLKTA